MKQRLNAVLDHAVPSARLSLVEISDKCRIQLWLMSEDYPQHQLSQDQIYHLMDNPPYWSFCWASGAVLAQLILDNPHWVADKTVVDFGAGSGVVAIAAKLAGAKSVIACDNDAVALDACRLNAEQNGVSLEYCDDYSTAPSADIITVADVFYDRNNLPLLQDMTSRYQDVWVSDSRLKGRALPGLGLRSQHDSHTIPDMAESAEFNTVSFYTKQQ